MTNTTSTIEQPSIRYSVAEDYEYSNTHKRRRLTLWSGSFASQYEAEAYSRPNGWTVHPSYGQPFHVDGPNERTDENYVELDKRLSDALNAYHTLNA